MIKIDKVNVKYMSNVILITLMSFSSCIDATKMTSLKDFKSNKKTSILNFSQKKNNDFYLISNKHINRIVTPFEEPSLKIDSFSDLKYKTSDNVIYLATPLSMKGKILAGFVTEKGDESNAIRFMFRPESLPPQEIQLKNRTYLANSTNKIAQRFESSHPRQNTIMAVLKKLAFQELPEGYLVTNPSSKYIPTCQQKGLEFDFFRGQLVSGGDYMVAIGTIKNQTKEKITFNEKNCYSNDVVAVAAYPNTKLSVHEVSEVFVMFYQKNHQDNKKTRQSLIGGL